MALIERFMGLEQPKLPVHQFMAVLAERQRGKLTTQQAIDAFTLSPEEQAEVVAMATRVVGGLLTPLEIHDVLLVAEAGIAPYDTPASVRTRLGA